MEYVNAFLFLHDAVNHPTDVRLAAIEKVTELPFFWGGGTPVWVVFEAENGFSEASVPFERCVGLPGVNFVVKAGEI
jgi:hypothetical protein